MPSGVRSLLLPLARSFSATASRAGLVLGTGALKGLGVQGIVGGSGGGDGCFLAGDGNVGWSCNREEYLHGGLYNDRGILSKVIVEDRGIRGDE